MKVFYFSFLISLMFFVANAQIVNIPDINFKAKLLSANSSNQVASTETPVYNSSVGNWVVSNYHTIDTNADGEIQVSEAVLVKYLKVDNSSIESLEGISNFNNLHLLKCNNNQITSLNATNLTSLVSLDIKINQLSTINVDGLTNLQAFDCSSNQLSDLDVSSLLNLSFFVCGGNQLTSLDLSSQTLLRGMTCGYNQLTYINLRNNFMDSIYLYVLNFSGNPNLQYICADEEDIIFIQQKVNSYGYTSTCNVNSYCSFTPGGVFYTIQGNTKFDGNANGCDTSDAFCPTLKYSITDGTAIGNLISNTSGNYSIPVLAGTHTLTPQLENPTYFTVTPASTTVSFPASTSPFVQDFCITPNGVHHDLEVVIIPIDAARPGFDATYKIKYKNKGTVSETATLVFNFDEAVLDFVSASVVPTQVNAGSLSWTIGAIAPFQSGEFFVILNVNSPMETPAVNAGDLLSYTATLNGLNTDETPEDNTFTLQQTVVNSFDPNDKTCLEGTTISPSNIGEYVHYQIRFENTGTFPAQNIVVKDLIDTTMFDVSTLQMTDASHSCVTRITNPNQVEFIFESINLPFDDANNDGYLVFKIRTKSTLVTGSTISNLANIYFDYNFPITTNTATSTFQTLQNDGFELDDFLMISPNPVDDFLTLSTQKDAKMFSVSIYNLLGQQIQTVIHPAKTLDVSGLQMGSYIIKVTTENGVSSGKFIKE